MEIINQFIVQRINDKDYIGIVICNHKQSIHYDFNHARLLEYLNGELHGAFKQYIPEIRYISGKMQHVRVLRRRWHYKNGKLHGKYEIWRCDGLQRFIANYSDGLFDGFQYAFHMNGVLAEMYYFRKGELHGFVNYYDESGMPIQSTYYKKIDIFTMVTFNNRAYYNTHGT